MVALLRWFASQERIMSYEELAACLAPPPPPPAVIDPPPPPFKPTVCVIDDCPRPIIRRRLCHLHYHRWRTYGRPDVAGV